MREALERWANHVEGITADPISAKSVYEGAHQNHSRHAKLKAPTAAKREVN
jgi:hypothetical protein